MVSDFQKVRVTFTDADGVQVSAVMWSLGLDRLCVYASTDNTDVMLTWDNVGDVAVTPISVLPTGVGAVIRAIGDAATYGDARDIYVSDQSGVWWSNNDGDVLSGKKIESEWTYKVLSEGIQL